ncbi:S-layer homology domain-containing protein [Ammoniphilus sp. YIM 78166]|uniref:S-layer homology domain-containing protein n=1 Tax=Ammoniphilus sp. YIM 78166 TaxID=1644106 RepID=UPI00106FF213|nr:S-layer homology domain-containing protein [Ammoniphilus sp. YIM 78166]
MNRTIKKSISSVLVFFLVFGLLLTTPLTADAQGKKFSDVDARHGWALQHITKMSLKGLVEGTPDGRFLPDQAVRQEQAIAMVVRAMGLKNEAETYTGTDYSTLYQGVSDWAKGYISVAHKEGLLKLEEGSRFRGETAASRQWIAQLLVRMIEKEAEARLYENVTSTFADRNTIDDWASNYVKLAASSEFELIKGFQNADGSFSFRPKQSVTRAQLAVLISLAEKHLPETVGNEVQGQILSFTGDEMILETQTGQLTLSLNANTAVFKENQKVGFTSLARYQPVNVLLGGANAKDALLIEILDEATAQETITGTLSKVLTEFKTIAVTTTGGLKTYQLVDQISFGSKDGTVRSINDLAVNDTIELTVVGGRVIKIYRVVGQHELSSKGNVYEVDVTNRLITIQQGTTSVKVYKIADNALITYPDQRNTGLVGLLKGMEVELKLDQSVITEIKVVTIIEEASILSVSQDQNYLTVKPKNSERPNVYKLSANSTIKIQGQTVSGASEVKAGDQVVLHIGADGTISSVDITSRTQVQTPVVGDLIEGKVFSIDKTTKTLLLEFEKDGKKTYQPYVFADTYELYINGSFRSNLDDIKKDMRAKLQLYNDKIVYLEVDNRLEGTVVRVDTERRILTLALANGEQKPYYVASNYDVNIRHISSPDLSDLERNDFVRVKLDNTEKITDIDVKREIAYVVTDTYESSKRLYVQNENKREFSLYLNAGVTLTIPAKDKPKFTEILKGDTVKATFVGEDLKAVEVLPSYKGMVTNINVEKKEYTVLKNDGTSVTLTFTTGDVIKYKTNEYTQLSSLAVNDRIQVNEWAGGKKRLIKMEKITAEYYYKDNNYIYIIEGVRSYKYAPELFVRSGNRGVTLDSLKRNDKIELYRLDDIVYEVNKTN